MNIGRALHYSITNPRAALRRLVLGREAAAAANAAVSSDAPVVDPVEEMWRQYGKIAREQGFADLQVVLSFDCDTPEDIEAAPKIADWLEERKFPGVFAVPGVMLERGADTYRQIAARGFEFLNHGYSPHTEWRDGRYWSITFYDKMEWPDIEADIRRGHEVVTAVTGRAPDGFRAPHFGCVDEKTQLPMIHDLLREMGYRYSSSTNPSYAWSNGIVSDRGGDFWEIATAGRFDSPWLILDSWTHVESPYRSWVTDDFVRSVESLIAGLLQRKICGAVNLYVDPSHVAADDAFKRCLDVIGNYPVECVSFSSLLSAVRK